MRRDAPILRARTRKCRRYAGTRRQSRLASTRRTWRTRRQQSTPRAFLRQMTLPTLRRFSYTALLVALTHLVFGAIVRISGSGMGCGNHWPLCYGRLFPPMDRPDLVVEWTHRLLASILVITVVAFAVVAWRARSEPGVGGRGGVLRAALLAVAAVVAAALLGALTVKLGNTPYATVAHWTFAMM